MSSSNIRPCGGPPYLPDSVYNHPDSKYAEDNGTMPENVADLASAVVGRRIVKAEKTAFNGDDFEAVGDGYWSRYHNTSGLVLTLDDGRRVALADTSDCCAYTELEAFLLHPERVDHVITGVASTDGFTRWHIYADYGDILELAVGWSAGNPFYYGYGFQIAVSNTIDGEVVDGGRQLRGGRHALPEGGAQ